MAPFPPLHSFRISPGALICALPVILEEEKTKARHSCFQILQGWSCGRGSRLSLCEPKGAELEHRVGVAVRQSHVSRRGPTRANLPTSRLGDHLSGEVEKGSGNQMAGQTIFKFPLLSEKQIGDFSEVGISKKSQALN